MIPSHVHCAECHQAIATKLAVRGGKSKDIPVRMGKQPRVLPTDKGLVAILVDVWLCDTCAERIDKAMAEQQASKLTVPQLLGPEGEPL